MKIGFLGINSKSVSFSIFFEKKGLDCLFYDENEDYVYNLNNKIFITNEPEIQMNLIDSVKISATTDVTEVIKESDFIFNFIELQSHTNGMIDTLPLFESLQQFYLCSHLNISLYNKNFVVCTTLNVGDSKKILEKISQFGLKFGYLPNLFEEGKIFKSIKENSFLILGSESSELFDQFSDLVFSSEKKYNEVIFMSLEAAEFVKFGMSSIEASKVVISNIIGDFMLSRGLEKEIPIVLNTFSKKENLNYSNLFYGLGFGGHNLPQEIRTISDFADKKNVECNFFIKILESNEEHLTFMKFYFMSKNPDKQNPFVFESLYHKKNTNILENSQKFKLCLDFLNEGYTVNVIQSGSVEKKLQKLSESYDYRLKFFKKGTNPEGYKINF